MNNSTNKLDHKAYTDGMADIIAYSVHRFSETEIKQAFMFDDGTAKYLIKKLRSMMSIAKVDNAGDVFIPWYLNLDEFNRKTFLDYMYGLVAGTWRTNEEQKKQLYRLKYKCPHWVDINIKWTTVRVFDKEEDAQEFRDAVKSYAKDQKKDRKVTIAYDEDDNNFYVYY